MTQDNESPETGQVAKTDDGKSTGTRANRFISTGSRAAVELFGGVADAFGGAVRKAGDEMNRDDLTRVDFKNGLLRGWVEGTAHFLSKLPDVVRNTYGVLESSVSDQKSVKRTG
jgi:hypothetical protein